MTYFEVKKGILSNFDAKKLNSGDKLQGMVNGKFAAIEVLSEEKIHRAGKGNARGEEGATVFDKPHWYSSRKAIVYLDNEGVDNLDWELKFAEDYYLPGSFQEVLEGLYKQALTQAGLRQTNQRSLDERLQQPFRVF